MIQNGAARADETRAGTPNRFTMGKKKDNDNKTLKSVVGEIFKTTDGFFGKRTDIKKARNVAVVGQRDDDGAVAVAKISKKRGKENKIGKTFIPDLVLKPEDHPALTEESIVNRQVIVGVSREGAAKPRSIFPDDMQSTGDSLTKKELQKVQEEVHNDDPKHRESYKKKMEKWRKHFKK